LSTRLTGLQYLSWRDMPPGNTASSREYGTGPFGVGEVVHGVRGVAQRALFDGEAALLDVGDFVADRDHRVAEAVDLVLRFRLGRLDHQVPGTGKLIVGAWKP
jgi:hypothetical protein